jgi:ribosomal protein S18 acetylase RimI-like enzyme
MSFKVGFVLFAIGDLQGKRNAHNSGTGVIPEFRGRRIVEQIYGVALPILKMNGVLTSTVEAITLNERAIRAYRKVGYEITRKLRCFGGKIDCKISEKGSSKGTQKLTFANFHIYKENV